MKKNLWKVIASVLQVLTMFATFATISPKSISAAQTFIKPVEGSYSSNFGMRNGKMHWGVDIAGNSGKTYDTLYAHMQSGSRKVVAGNRVTQGQAIGIVGSTGNSTGPHLHFELHTGTWNSSYTNAVDPKPYIDGQINPVTPHVYDGTWASVKIINPNGGVTANLFGNVGYGIIGTLPVGNGQKVYGEKEYAANGDLYYNVGPGYIHNAYGIISNHHATVASSISTYNSPNGTFNRTLSPGTYKVHAAKDNWYDLGANTWVKASQVTVTKK